ncbi:MAG: prepilin peptidase [Paracoccaceae bacterium]
MTAADLHLLALVPILVIAAVSDLRHLRIANLHVLLALGLFLIAAPFVLTWPELTDRLLVAAIAFALGFALFALGLFGGGDVKMMPVILLFVPSGDLVLYLRLFAAALLLVTLAARAAQALPEARKPAWQSLRSRGHVPVGVAMALSVMMLLALRVSAT